MSTTTRDQEFQALADAHPEKGEQLNIMRALTANYGPEQVVAFGSRRPTKAGVPAPHYLAAVTAEQVWGWLPELWMYELEFAHASFWILQPLRPDQVRPAPTAANNFKPAYFEACDGSVDGLNCIPIDLDVGREGLPSATDALKLIADAVMADQIPAPSYVALSGRGAYAIWQLRDLSGGMPARTDRNITRWRSILWRLVDATKQLELKPDGNATNLARWLKLPGTKDTLIENGQETKSGNKVVYLAFTTGLGAKPVIYTFDALEKSLGMSLTPEIASEPVAEAPILEIRRSRSRVRGDKRDGSYVHAARVHEIVALNNARGGMREGARHMALFYFHGACRALYGCKYPGEGVADELAKRDTFALNADFSPPLSKEEVERAIDRPKVPLRKRQVQAATIARALDVAASEAEALGLKAIAPTEVRKAIRDREAGEKLDRATARAELNAAIDDLLMKEWGLSKVARYLGTDRQRVDYHRRALFASGRLVRPPSLPPEQVALPGVG